MASKVVFFLLITCFLVINTKVSSEREESVLIESPALAPAPSPIYGSPPLPPPQATPAPSLVPLPPPQASPAPSPVPLPPPQASPAPSPVPLPPPPQAAPAPSPVVEPPTPSAPPARRPRNILECIPLCVVRCKFHPRILRCMTSCLTCCGRCRCVPPGQHGNKEQCGTCYTGMKTRNGTPRCP